MPGYISEMKAKKFTYNNSKEVSSLTKLLILCGPIASVLYVALNIFIPMGYEGYDSISQTVSEISAVDAPTRPVWVWWGIVYTLLTALFGWGVMRAAGSNRFLRISGMLLLIYGSIGILWSFTPMHQRAVIASGGGTISDTLHIVMSVVSVFFMFIAILYGSKAFGKAFRFYSLATILVFLVFGILTSIDAPKISADLPTPFIGVWERINIGAFLVWVIVFATILLSGKRLSATAS
jgi:hypothetical protein